MISLTGVADAASTVRVNPANVARTSSTVATSVSVSPKITATPASGGIARAPSINFKGTNENPYNPDWNAIGGSEEIKNKPGTANPDTEGLVKTGDQRNASALIATPGTDGAPIRTGAPGPNNLDLPVQINANDRMFVRVPKSSGGINSISLAPGTNPGTLKLTVDGNVTDNITVTNAETTNNKSTNIATDRNNDSKYPSVKAMADYVAGYVDEVMDGISGGDVSNKQNKATGVVVGNVALWASDGAGKFQTAGERGIVGNATGITSGATGLATAGAVADKINSVLIPDNVVLTNTAATMEFNVTGILHIPTQALP